MALPNTFSRRKRQRENADDDVYQYASMSDSLRQQVLFFFADSLNLLYPNDWEERETAWSVPVSFMRRELGRSVLHPRHNDDFEQEFSYWFKSELNTDLLLDAVEVLCRLVVHWAGRGDAAKEVKTQVATLNARFREAAFGFRFEGGEIVQISSEYAHSEVVAPALRLLAESRFGSANEEYRKAHQEYRARQYEDCISDCGKALESVLKVIAKKRGWREVGDTSTLSQLLKAAKENGLFASYMEEQITGLSRMLQGVGTVRNKDGAHGKGASVSNADENLAAYQLHQTAAAIIFLAKQ